MFFIKTQTLFKMCMGGGVICTGFGCYVIRKRENMYRDTQFFEEALETVQKHTGAQILLGAPITASRVHLTPPKDNVESPIAEFSARLSGSKDRGYMFFWAERKLDHEQVKININRIEVEVDSDNTKRLIVKAN